MNMGKILIVGVGGYFGLKYLLGIDLLAGLGTSTTAPPATSTPQANAPITADIKSMIIAKVTQNGGNATSVLWPVDDWNWYYQEVRGVSGPAPEDLFPGRDRNTKYSIDEYWGAMSAKGFSGLYTYHGMQGMGVVSRQNPWVNHYSPGPGRTILPLGSETFIKMFG